jgi:hypothetical protein
MGIEALCEFAGVPVGCDWALETVCVWVLIGVLALLLSEV